VKNSLFHYSNIFGSIRPAAGVFVLVLAFCSLCSAAPSITSGPAPQTATIGQNVTFSVSATGSLLKYQWLKGGSPIAGATSSTLSLNNVQNSDAFPYAVTVSNSTGFIISDPANLIVENNNNPGGSSVFLSPRSRAVPQGTAVSWSVSSQARRYTWRKNGATIRDDWKGGYWSGVWLTTSSSYSISLATASDAGNYDVVIEDAATGTQTTSTLSTLVVNVTDFPSILSQPASGIVGAGNTFNLSVHATGSGTLLYQWYKDGIPIVGANTATYSFNVVETSDAGTYAVQVSNHLGTVDSADAFISVLSRPVLSPSSQSVNQGESVSWSITTTNANRFTWRKNGSAVWTDYQYGGWSGVMGGTTSTYTINPALSSHAGTYDVVVHRVQENVDVVSTPSVLTVSVANEPYITQQPANVSSSVGSSAQFTVAATGAEPLKYQWYRNGAKISSATNPTLIIANAQTTDALKYNVVMSNSYGRITSSIATLTLESTLPGATLIPSTRAAPEGVQVSWNYGVNNGSLYTWRKNGVTVWQDNKGSGWSGVLGWTSSTYTIPSTQLSDTGDYDVVVQVLNGGSTGSTISKFSVESIPTEATDSDGDGIPDEVENIDGTDPNSPSSHNSINLDLIGYYPFNGDATDKSGYGNNGSVSGASLAQDRFGNTNRAYLFAANGGGLQCINLGTSSHFNFGTNNYSISCWVKLTGNQTGRYIIAKYASVGGSGFGLGTSIDSVPYFFAKGTEIRGISTGPNLNSGTWKHIVVTHDQAGDISYFIDGQLVQTTSGNIAGPISNGAPLIIGGLNIDGVQQFEGLIDDVRVYKRKLSSNEIADLYQDSNSDGISDERATQLGYNPSQNFRPLMESFKTSPPAGLYNQAAFDSNRVTGRSDVTNNPNTYSLYRTDQILNMRMGGMVLSSSNNQLNLNYEIQQSPDLSNWSSYLNQTVTITNAPTNKMFLRILPKQ
jgi:hypothetical protein